MNGWMKYLYILACCGLTSCSPAKKEEVPQKAPEPPAVETPDHDVPEKAGAYVWQDGRLTEMAAGKPNLLIPTNADRGFGFGLPAGMTVNADVQDFTVLATPLKPDALQVTEFRGVAADVQDILADAGDDSVAWLPVSTQNVEIKVWDKERGLMDLHLEAPLKPGFYVLHDDSLFRSRNTDKVTGYYPFAVTGKAAKEMPWVQDAASCFESIHNESGVILTLDDPSEKVQKNIQNCIHLNRIARKAASKGESQSYLYKLLYLGRLGQPKNISFLSGMIDLQNPQGSEPEMLLWETVHADHLMRLKALYEKASSGQQIPTSQANPVTQYYLGKAGEQQLLASLLWMPFALVDSSDDNLSLLFQKAIHGDRYEPDLLGMLGALAYREVQGEVSKTNKHAAWFKALSKALPESWIAMSQNLKPRNDKSNIVMGPFVFEEIPETEQSAWVATFQSKQREIRSCINDKSVLESAVFVLEQPVYSGSLPGKAASGVLRDPIAESRGIPVIQAETVHCILKVFESLPAEPSLDNHKRVKMGLTIVKKLVKQG